MKYLPIYILLFITLVSTQQLLQIQDSTCRSQVISLVPKTMKYHNQINNTKQLTCKSSNLPSFVLLDEKCYLMVAPLAAGDFPISVTMIVTQKKSDGSQYKSQIQVPYILTITKIRYNGPSQQGIEYDVSLNRVIDIETPQNSWLVSPGQAFLAQFTVKQTQNLYQKVFYQFINLPNGLKGNQLNGVIEGNVQAPPGYYSFAVRVFDLEGNSETIEATILVHDQKIPFQLQNFEDQETLKSRLAQINKSIADNALIIAKAKLNIEKKLQLIASARTQLSDLNTQQRKLEGTEKSLSYAMNWTKLNLDNMKAKYLSIQQTYNDYSLIVNQAKRTYQTSVFGIQEKQSQILKQQVEADGRFELYLQGDKGYNRVRLELDECERKNEGIAKDVMNNLKELDRANFVQNLYDIIQSK